MEVCTRQVRPHANASYVVFTSYDNRSHGFCPEGYPWPYHEALTLEEATNELAFLSTGMYQAPPHPPRTTALRGACAAQYVAR